MNPEQPPNKEDLLKKLEALEARKAEVKREREELEGLQEGVVGADKKALQEPAEEIIAEAPQLTEAEFEEIISKDSEIWEQDIKTFKLDLEALLPPSFNYLTEEQKIKVLQDSKRRIVDIVKSDAQIQYSEDLKERMQENIGEKWKHKGKLMTGIRSLKTSIKSSFTKERDLKNTENEVYLKLINSAEGKKLIAEDLELLVDKTNEQFAYIGYNSLKGEQAPMVSHISNIDTRNLTDEEYHEVLNFDRYANEFAQMPYEWGQEKRKKYWGNRKKYDDAKANYEKAKAKVLEIKEKEGDREKALVEILKADNEIKMEQLLNTHPEFEKVLRDFEKTSGWKEKFKTAGSTINTLSGKNMINRGLVAGGALIRTGANILPWLAGAGTGVATLSSAIAAPVVGGVAGYWRGKFRAKETLSERQKLARHGQKDESTEKVAMADVARLTERLQDMINEIELATPEKKAKKIANLAVRIEHTMGKVEKGQVNFGDAKVSLVNQFNLVNTLNEAVALREINSPEMSVEVKNRIDIMLKTVGEGVAKRTSSAQNKFITKQAWKGAALGAGLAGIGYGVRWLSEHVGFLKGELSDSTKSPEITNTNKNNVGNNVANKSTTTPKTTQTQTADEVVPVAPKSVEGFVNQGIKIERGGAIKAISDLQKQIKAEYPDITKAPQNIQDFVNADPTKKAIELGFYKPGQADESALIVEGSILKFDEKGNLLFGKPDASGNIPPLGDQYTGKMLDSDKPKITEERPRIRKISRVVNNTEDIKTQKGSTVIEDLKQKSADNNVLKRDDTQINIDAGTVVKEQAPAAAMDAPVTDKKPAPKTDLEKKPDAKIEKGPEIEKPKVESTTEKTDPSEKPQPTVTPEAQKAKIETQIELTEKYPELKGSPFIKNPPLGVSGERIVEINKLYNESIAKLSENDAENWSYVKDAPTKNFLGQKIVEGDKMVPYLNKLKEVSGLSPDYNIIDGDESIEKYMVRVHEWAIKNGKLAEIKNIKIGQ